MIEDGVLQRVLENPDGIDQTVSLVPKNGVDEILVKIRSGSSGGHLSVAKTLEKVREWFYQVNCKEGFKDW